MKRAFNKPATSCAQQVAILQQRGMEIANPAQAEFYLQHLNYCLGAYWLPFEADHATHSFKPGTRFEDVLNHYIFDRELRLLLLDAIERIEVSVRTQWAYQMAHRHGPHAHLDPALARDWKNWVGDSAQLAAHVESSRENFIQHLTRTYAESLPPVWAVCEIIPLGLLSRLYRNIKPMATRSAVSRTYGVDQQVFESWLHHLHFLRNLCAHHSRVWNREFVITPETPKSKPQVLRGQFQRGSRKLYNSLLILLHLMDVIAPNHHWRQRLTQLIDTHAMPTGAMGFPPDWRTRAIWQGGAE